MIYSYIRTYELYFRNNCCQKEACYVQFVTISNYYTNIYFYIEQNQKTFRFINENHILLISDLKDLFEMSNPFYKISKLLNVRTNEIH